MNETLYEDAAMLASFFRRALGIDLILERILFMSAQIDALTAAVQAEDDVVESAVTLLNGLPQLIADAVAKQDAGDDTALDTLIADIKAKTSDLSQAVAANTPAANAAPATGDAASAATPSDTAPTTGA